MREKFEFEVAKSLNTIGSILEIAKKFKDEESFTGSLAKNLFELGFEINNEQFINILNKNLITCRNFSGLEIVRAWDGGFQHFKEEDYVLRLQRLALFIVIYQRELSFRGNYRIDQGNNFYYLCQLVRNNRSEFSEKSAWCLELLDDLPALHNARRVSF